MDSSLLKLGIKFLEMNYNILTTPIGGEEILNAIFSISSTKVGVWMATYWISLSLTGSLSKMIFLKLLSTFS